MRLEAWIKNKRAPWIALAAVLVMMLVFAPGVWTKGSRGTASSFNDDAFGISGFYRLATKLGWRAERRTSDDLSHIYPGTFVSVAPVEEMTPREVHVVLEEVRRGAGLLINAHAGSPLSDSLGVYPSPRRAPLPTQPRRRGCRPVVGNSMLTFGNAAFLSTVGRARHSPLRDSAGQNFFPLDSTLRSDDPQASFDAARPGKDKMFQIDFNAPFAAARGIQYGRGRIVVLGSALPLRNDVLRMCTTDAATPSIEILQYLGNGGSDRLIFDEFRHGYGERGDVWAVLGNVFTTTAPGRGLLQLLVAGLIFLGAAAVRDVRPRVRIRIERRSPFEHVNALAAAYSRAGATTLATKRLVQGLRRRMPARMSPGAKESDQRYLENLAAIDKSLESPAAIVRAGLASRTTEEELLAIGKSIEHIERSVKGE